MKLRVTTCQNHPQRETSLRCQRCGLIYCDECLQPYEGTLICPTCTRELEEAARLRAEARRPFWQRWNRDTLNGLLIRLAFIGILVGIGFIAVRFFGSQTLTDDEYARISMGMRLQVNEPINVLSLAWGTKIESTSSEQEDYLARRILDAGATAELPGWRSQGTAPQEMIIKAGTQIPINQVNTALFMVISDAPQDTWAKNVEVQVADSPTGPWRTLGSWTLQQVESPQMFKIETTTIRGYVRLLVRSNHGSSDYISLGEFELQARNEMR